MTDIVERLRTELISAPPEHPVHPSICTEAADEIERLNVALNKINDIRNDVIGSQRAGWSNMVYPLVAILEEAGFEGEGYDVARERIRTWITEIERLRAALEHVLLPLGREGHIPRADARRRYEALIKEPL